MGVLDLDMMPSRRHKRSQYNLEQSKQASDSPVSSKYIFNDSDSDNDFIKARLIDTVCHSAEMANFENYTRTVALQKCCIM